VAVTLSRDELAVLTNMVGRVRHTTAVAVSHAVFKDTPSARTIYRNQMVKACAVLESLRQMGLISSFSSRYSFQTLFSSVWMTSQQRVAAYKILRMTVDVPVGMKSVGLTESGSIALRILYRNDRPMMAWEVGKEGFRHIAVTTRHNDARINPRTMSAASALKKLCADGYATRLSVKSYGLSPEQRGYIRANFPRWVTRTVEEPAPPVTTVRQGRAVELD
jgi:hypothetical protein